MIIPQEDNLLTNEAVRTCNSFPLQEESGWSCKGSKVKCCKKYKKGDQCRKCPKLAVFDELINRYYLENSKSGI